MSFKYHYICINPSCKIGIYNNAESIIEAKHEKQTCPLCKELLFSVCNSAISQDYHLSYHLFTAVLKQSINLWVEQRIEGYKQFLKKKV